MRLRGCLNDVVSVMGLPAVWGGTEPPQILATLMDALFGMLRLTFVFIRLSDPDGGPPIELMRIASPFEGALRAQDLTDALGVGSSGRTSSRDDAGSLHPVSDSAPSRWEWSHT